MLWISQSEMEIHMKILVVSDTHGDQKNFLKVINKEKDLDMVFHCGDVCGGEYTIIASAGCPVEMIAGNNDFFSPLEEELEFDVEGKKVLLTHGHHYYVSTDPELIKREARSRNVDLVCYGHTHYPSLCEEDGLVVLNPGSLTYPRQSGHQPTYAIVQIDEKGCIKVELKELFD